MPSNVFASDIDEQYNADYVSVDEINRGEPSLTRATFETENSLISALARYEGFDSSMTEVDPDFDVVGYANQHDLNVADRMEMMSSRNQEEFDWKLNNLQRERDNREVIQDASLTSSLSLTLVAGITDPVAWAMAPIPLLRGATFAARFAKAAPIGMADMAFTETVLHATQTERGLDESLYAVGGGALFAGVLGGWLGRADIAEQVSKIEADVIEADGSGKYYMDTYEAPIPEGSIPNPDRSAGAAETRTYIAERYVSREIQDDMYNRLYAGEIDGTEFASKLATIASESQQVVAGPVLRFVKELTPATAASFSKNWRVVALGDKLMESSLLKKFHLRGKSGGQALDTMIEARVGMEMVGRLAIGKKHYGEMLGTQSGIKQGYGDAKAIMGFGDQMSLADFNREITKAFDNSGKHANKHVEAAAQELRQMDVAYEKELVDNKVLMPGNYQEGLDLDAAAAKNDSEYKKLSDARDRIVEQLEKGRIEIDEARRQLDEVNTLADTFNAKNAQAQRQRTNSAKYRRDQKKARLSKTDSTLRRQKKADYELRKANSPLTVRVNKAKEAKVKIEATKPKQAYANVARLEKLKSQLTGGGSRGTKAASNRQKAFQKARIAERRNGQKEVAAYEAKLAKADADLKKAQPTPAELRKEGATLANMQRDYREIPSPKQVQVMRDEIIQLDKIAREGEGIDALKERQFLAKQRKAQDLLKDTESRAKGRLKNKAKRLDLNQKRMEERLIEGNRLAKELDDFAYDPTHGDPMGGGWYTPRVFRTQDVFANKEQFLDRTVEDLISQMKQATRDPKLSPDELQKAIDDYIRATSPDGEGRRALRADMTETWQRITHSSTGYEAVTLSGKNKFKAQRKLSVSNSALRGDGTNVDFLESDYFALKKAHIRAMSPELTMKEQGFNFAEDAAAIDAEYQRLIDEVGEGSKEGKRLRKEQDSLIGENGKLTRVNELLHNRLGNPTNPFGPANRMRSAMMNWNLMRALGSMTISALPDLGNIIAKVGLSSVSRQLTTIATHPSKFKMGITAARRLSLVTERVMASRMNQIALTGNLAPGVGAAERGMHKAANYFITATGMNHWNQAMKEFVITAYSDEIMRTARKLAKNPNSMSDLKKAKFAQAGIDADDWAKIAEQHAIHGENAGGLEIPNIDLWDDDIQYKLMMVLKKESDTAVVTPGAGDLPLWMRSHVGGMMGQFKSFSFAATNKILLPSVQRMTMGDPSAMFGMTTQLALGSAVYGLKMQLQGREPDTEWNTLVRESIDRSGYFGIFADANAILEKVSRGTLGIQGVYNQLGIESPELSRYYTRPIMGDIFGPSVGTIEDMNKVIGSVFKDEYTRGDISAWRRMIPGQNLFYLRNGFNQIQDGANDWLVK